MRIELPSTPWADSAHRADDDAHTLTVAPLNPEPGAALRALVPDRAPVTLTLTF